MTPAPIIRIAAQIFGKPRLANAVAAKGLTFKFLAVNAVNFLAFKLGLERSFAPAYVVMEPAGYCNLKCPMCYLTQHGENRNARLMSLDFFRDFIKRNKRYLTHIHYGMWGEPLLNKDFPEMVQVATRAGIKSITATLDRVSRLAALTTT